MGHGPASRLERVGHQPHHAVHLVLIGIHGCHGDLSLLGFHHHCEIHVGSQDWQSNPDNVTAFATLVRAHVAVVQDAGHSLPTTYVSALLDRWL